MISELIGARIRNYTLHLGEFLARFGLTPNAVTAIGLVLNLLVAAIIARGDLQLAGVMLLIASGFDMLDGAVARATGTVTKFGGFLDSTLDRYSESIVYGGVLIYLLGTNDFYAGALLVFAATTGSLLISYARARAEAAGFKASVGLLARPERVLVLAIGLLTGQLVAALWILAIGTHLTVVTRIAHVWRLSRHVTPREGINVGDSNSHWAGEPEDSNVNPEIETVPTTAADVESAGRSCLAIIALAVVIFVLLLIWIVVRSTGGG